MPDAMTASKRSAQCDVPALVPEKIKWEVANSAGKCPAAREGHCSCVVGNRLYIFGGVSMGASDEILEMDDLWMFDAYEQAWTQIAYSSDSEKPLSRSAATMVSVGSKLYLFGGLNHSVGWLDDFFIFDTETSKWVEDDEFTGDTPSPRDKLCSAVIGQHIWLFGGFGPQAATRGPLDLEDEDEYSSEDEIQRLESEQQAAQFGWFEDLHVYDTVERSWSQPVQLSMGKPSPRCAASMVAYGSTLVIFGGRDAEGRLDDIHFFDTETKKWVKDRDIHGSPPPCRSFHCATLVSPSAMLVSGGRSTQDQHFNDIHCFDLDTNIWSKIDNVGMTARGCHTLNTVGSHMLMFGGSSSFNASLQHCDVFHGDLLIAAIAGKTESKGSPVKNRKAD